MIELQSKQWTDALTTEERDAIGDDGALLINDPLWTDDEVARWRRYLDVVHNYRWCEPCGLWTRHQEGHTCPRCGQQRATSA